MRLLLDTNILIDALREQKAVQFRLIELAEQHHTLMVSAINIGEVYGGMRPNEAVATEELLSSFDCLPVTAALGRTAGSFQASWLRRGRTLSLADMIIAATALEQNAALVTKNRRDFPIPELEFYEFV